MHRSEADCLEEPSVILMWLALSHCLNLLDHAGLMEMKAAYDSLAVTSEYQQQQQGVNQFKDASGAYLVRTLDCAVLENLHYMRNKLGLPEYDTVIGAFWEGKDLYENAGVTDKNHMQVCVRNAACIRGYFRVRELDGIDLFSWMLRMPSSTIGGRPQPAPASDLTKKNVLSQALHTRASRPRFH